MIPASGAVRRAGPCDPADAQGVAVLLLAILLAAGTALPQLGTGGPVFPPPPAPQMVERSAAARDTRAADPTAALDVGAGPVQPATESAGPLDINTANREALQGLPGIGPALAGRIVAERTAHGPFRTAEDLLRVPGIGPKRWERIRPLVRLAEEP